MATTRCKATTASGNRCRNNAVDGSVYCGVHKAKPKAKSNRSAPSVPRPPILGEVVYSSPKVGGLGGRDGFMA